MIKRSGAEGLSLSSPVPAHLKAARLVADLHQRAAQQFRAALVSRDIIGQAKGKMTERFNIDADEAFNMLKLVSQHSNTPVAQVAQRVVSGDVWPPTP
jgi:AmiR/NasT family two-component response regulator